MLNISDVFYDKYFEETLCQNIQPKLFIVTDFMPSFFTSLSEFLIRRALIPCYNLLTRTWSVILFRLGCNHQRVIMSTKPRKHVKPRHIEPEEELERSDTSTSSLNLHMVDPTKTYVKLKSESDEDECQDFNEETMGFEENRAAAGPSQSYGQDHSRRHPYDRKPVLDQARRQVGIEPAESIVHRKGVSNEQLYQYMVARAAKDDEHHAVMRNILAIVKRMEDAWTPTKSIGRSGAFQSFFHH